MGETMDSKENRKGAAKAPCDCGGPFDAEAAFQRLARDVARLADLEANRASPPERSGVGGDRSILPAPAGVAAPPGGVEAALGVLRKSREDTVGDPASPSAVVGGRATRGF